MDGVALLGMLAVGLMLVAALFQAGPGMREKIGYAGLAITGILSLVLGVFSIGGRGDPGWSLIAAALSFGALAALNTFRPQR
jgi:hypothetical protein